MTTDPWPLTVLHATEAMSSGVITVLQSFGHRQVDAGASVQVWYVRRPRETPPHDELRARFSDAIPLREFGAGGRRRGLMELTIALWRVFNGGGPDVVHVHSSLLGVSARVAYLFSRRRTRLFYSPHGFAFLRMSTGRVVRTGTRWAESLLGRVGDGIVATCESERRIAESVLSAHRVYTVGTGVDERTAEAYPPPVRRQPDRPVVAMIGRLAYQKAPWRFAEVARRLGHRARFVWFGASPDDPTEEWIGDAPVEIVGWMSPDELEERLARVDVILFPSLWEGMPYGLMMTQVRGIPAVVSDVVGNRDAVQHGVTGFVAKDDAELADFVGRLVSDPELRFSMAGAAWERGRRELTDRDLGHQTIDLYGGVRA